MKYTYAEVQEARTAERLRCAQALEDECPLPTCDAVGDRPAIMCNTWFHAAAVFLRRMKP